MFRIGTRLIIVSNFFYSSRITHAQKFAHFPRKPTLMYISEFYRDYFAPVYLARTKKERDCCMTKF